MRHLFYAFMLSTLCFGGAISVESAHSHPETYSEGYEDSSAAIEPLTRYYANTSHPAIFQHVVCGYPDRSAILLGDGSYWHVNSSEFYKLTYDWEVEDFVVILPYHSWFSNDTFRLSNCRTGATIHLQLIRVFTTEHSIPLCVVGFQPERQQVLLSDGSCWEVPLADRSTFLRWEQGDVVLLGINDGGLSTYYPNILINPRLDFYDSYHRYLRGCYLGQY